MDVDPMTIVGFAIALMLVTGMLVSSLNARKHRLKRERSLELLRAMFEKSNVGKTETIPGGGKIIRANRAFCRFLGYEPEDLYRLTWRELSHPDDHEEAAKATNEMLAAAQRGEDPDPVTFFVRYLGKDGDWRPAFVNVTYVRGHGCEGILLAEVQRTDEFAQKHRKSVEERGLSFVGVG